MAQFFLIDGTDIGVERVRLGSQDGYSSFAERGTVSTSMIAIDDPMADLTITGWKSVAVLESACSHASIFRGYMAARNIGRGDGDSLISGAARRYDCDIVDLNAKLYWRAIHTAAGKRPQETDIARRNWLVNSQWFPSDVDTDAFVSDAEPATLDAADYRGQYAADVLNDCVSARFGKNYFIDWDETLGAFLFYGPTDTATLTSTLRISNVEADRDEIVTFSPWRDAKLVRDPSSVYAGVYLQYAAGAIYRFDSATTAAFLRRDITIRNDRIGKLSTAESIAAQWLARYANEEDRITCTVRLPASKVNLIRQGMRVECKFSHLPGYSSFTFMRVVRRLVKQVFESEAVYDVELEMVPARRVVEGGGVGTPPGGGGGGPGPFVPPATTCSVDNISIVQQATISGIEDGGEVTLPAPVTAGNLLVVGYNDRDGDDAVIKYPPGTTLAGFTDGPDGLGLTTNVSGQKWFYKIATGDEQAIIVNGSSVVWIHYFELAGVTIVNGHSNGTGAVPGGGGSFTGAAATTTAPAFVIGSVVTETSDVHVASHAWAAGWTEIVDKSAGSPPPNIGPSWSVAYRIENAGTYTPSGTMTTTAGPGALPFNAQVVSFACSPDDDEAAPGPGQQTCEEFTADGCEDEYALNHPYLENSLNLKIGGIPAVPVQTDPDAGIFGTPFLVSSGVPIIACYQAGAGPATGSNNPQPSSTTLIAPQMLGSGAVGAGLLTLTDAQTYVPFRLGNQGGLELTSIGSNGTIDVAAANVFEITLQSDLTFTLTNVPEYAGRESDITLLLRQSGTGPWDVTWPGNIDWVSGEPTLSTTSNSVTPVGLMTLDQGATWIGLTGGGSGSVSSNEIWRPVMAFDGTNWMVVVAADGTAVMAQG